MELRHLRYFAAVAETRHFGRAAERLRMAQPPLSQAIRQLEAELGVALFHRTTRQVGLTGAGEVFHTDVVRILRSVDEAAARAQRFAQGAEGILRIGLTGSAGYRHLPELARTVKRELPGVALEVHTEMFTPAQEAALSESRLDIGVLRPPVRGEGITCRDIAQEPLVLVLPEDHWLAESPEVPLERLRGEDFIMYAATSRSIVSDAVISSCLTAGFHPHTAHEVTETSTALALVAAGLGVALLPDSVRSVSRDGVVFRPVPDAQRVRLALAWRTGDTSPLLAAVLAALTAADAFPTGDASPDVTAPSRAGAQNHRGTT
ncbi:LysR family transcriptional regulator [Streptomyces sp. NBC_00009]|uniref:LysR family transcriptional regulator n=1 Tax=Streptomyces sp. NBC_00009 TaxID=2975620 RepID=UPI00324A94F7